MSKFVNITLVAIAALLFCAYIEARATPTATPVSFLDDIQLNYNLQKGLWQCDMVACPNTTVRCQILRYNDVNKTSSLWRVNNCYNSRNIPIYSLYFEQSNFSSAIKVNINVTSFIGVSTELIYGYTNTSQTVNGTARWEDWPNVQRQYRGIILEASQNQSANYRGY